MKADTPNVKPWSQCSSDELLDMAQAEMQKPMLDRNHGLASNYLHAAQVRASSELAWEFEVRFLPMLTNAIWEGLRTR